MSIYKLVCPHCQAKMRIRTSNGVHLFLRVAYLQCVNESCGWACRAQFEMTHELSPSGMPNPSIELPAAGKALRLKVQRGAHGREPETQLDAP
jgi:hypothetical protein